MSQQQKEMTPEQKQSIELCKAAPIREYCKRVHFFIYDLDNPTPNGDCNETFSLVLGDAIAYIIKAKRNFKNYPKIDVRFVKQICYNNDKKFTVVQKSTNKRIKIICKSESIKMENWDSAKLLLWS